MEGLQNIPAQEKGDVVEKKELILGAGKAILTCDGGVKNLKAELSDEEGDKERRRESVEDTTSEAEEKVSLGEKEATETEEKDCGTSSALEEGEAESGEGVNTNDEPLYAELCETEEEREQVRKDSQVYGQFSVEGLVGILGLPRALKVVVNKVENRHCADCNAPGPSWAELNHGVLVCISCSSIHREMGVSVSRIKSVQLDDFTLNMLKCLDEGNIKINEQLESCRPACFHKLQPNDQTVYRRRYIVAKYQEKVFCESEDKVQSENGDNLMPYMSGELEVVLMKKGRRNNDWPKRTVQVSQSKGTVSYWNAEESKDNILGCLPLSNLNAILFHSSELDQSGSSTILLLTTNELQPKKGKACTRNIFLKGSYHGKELVDLYLTIRQAKAALLSLEDPNMATRPFALMGWAFKRGKQLSDDWRRRWCVLDNCQLRYYDNPMNAVALGEINLGSAKEGYGIVDGYPLKTDCQVWTFTLKTNHRDYWLLVNDEQMVKKWKSALQEAIDSNNTHAV